MRDLEAARKRNRFSNHEASRFLAVLGMTKKKKRPIVDRSVFLNLFLADRVERFHEAALQAGGGVFGDHLFARGLVERLGGGQDGLFRFVDLFSGDVLARFFDQAFELGFDLEVESVVLGRLADRLCGGVFDSHVVGL